MKKINTLSRFFCFILLLNVTDARAQLPDCDKIYMDKVDLLFGQPVNNSLYTYDPAQPVSGTNPSINTISYPAGCTGFAVSTVLGSSNNTRTFYTVNYQTGKIYYYDPVTLAWVNTGHAFGDAAAVNLAAGGGYIYSLAGATGKIYKYDGTGNGSLLITVNDFAGEGPYDLIADCDGNIYIFNGTGDASPPFLRKYSPTGALLQAWTVNNAVNAVPTGGFAIVGNTFYTDNIDLNTFTVSIASGTTAGNVININNTSITIPSFGALEGAGDLASCDAAIGLTAGITITSSETQICGSRNVSFWVTAIDNGGAAPLYQWLVNGNPVPGATDTFFIYAPQNGDIITCRLTSNKNCVIIPTVMSNAVTMFVENAKEPVLTYNPDAFCIVSAPVLPTVDPAGGTFSSTAGLSLNTATGEITPALSTPGEYVITYVNPTPVVCPQYSTTAIVNVYPPADVTIKTDDFPKPVCLNDTVVLYTNEVKGSVYQWEPSDRIAGSNDASSAIIERDKAGYVSLTVYAKGGCSGKDSVWVDKGKSCCSMFIPSAFTPNNDAFNDVFKIEKHDVRAITHIKIFNRYGQMVFEADNENMAWDGTHKDKYCDVGTYFYTISYSCDDGIQKEIKGDITLVR